ncbi:carnitine O-palmitoyltransferase 1, liver isoform-like [Bradysia coprophila]|uniref:carnitine O-palmitoyltransferase 1, liver isoform-like n=1 Tax=Bradysia coprophila TaxID=38358 RepID=UPI00187DC76A|nr:carnitine O-palmitoyltransferase 1, liver isoform-like [Bradysia coprophila]
MDLSQLKLHSFKKRLNRWARKSFNALYPASIEGIWIIFMLLMCLHFAAEKVPFDLVNVVLHRLPGSSRSSLTWHLTACSITSFMLWLVLCAVMKVTLKILLTYRGFMFESRGKGVSLKTKIWGVLLGSLIKMNKRTLYSFQSSLPTLPLPSLNDTVRRYLRSIRPLIHDADYQRITKEAQDFQTGIGKKLQRYLLLKRLWATNYVSDWWEQYVYLRGRSPLMVNSNYHTFDVFKIPSRDQTARAAGIIYEMLKFREKLDKEDVSPVMAQGLVPLCSNQYRRMYNTARVPGIECDKIEHYEDIDHIVVLCNGCYYKVTVQQHGRLFNACELKHQFDHVLTMNEIASKGEKYLGSLTAWDRTNWAIARETYFSTGINKASLQVVESAAMFLVLHDKPFEFGTNLKSEKMAYYASQCMYGSICDRWFDKSFQLIVGTNGRYAFNAEHTWADAPVLIHMIEEMHLDELQNYDVDGNLHGKMLIVPPIPTRIQWSFNEDLLNTIDDAYNDSLKLAADVDYKVLFHNAFGKGFIKSCNLSPDAYIQMALQLAYYRDYGKFSLTYESSMTRLYREGRTETVRSCTIESSAWVKSMEDNKSDLNERVKLLRIACKQHQAGYIDAMCGRGIDRHLFALYVVSKYLEIDSPFLKDVINEPWRLSTSQTPHGQTPKIDLKKYPQLLGPGGGFGPVARDGYGVSYIISSENDIYFHISSVKSCDVTDSERFANQIRKAMNDIKLLFEEYTKDSQQIMKETARTPDSPKFANKIRK